MYVAWNDQQLMLLSKARSQNSYFYYYDDSRVEQPLGENLKFKKMRNDGKK